MLLSINDATSGGVIWIMAVLFIIALLLIAIVIGSMIVLLFKTIDKFSKKEPD